jgi:tetratricopeptide (TPR) repeat protein
MGSAAIKPLPGVGQLLRKKRRELKLSLQAVSERLAARGHRIPPSTLGRIEQGRLDPGVRRLYLLLDLYRIPPHLVSDLVEVETLAGAPPLVVPTDDLQALHDQGIEHWRSGNVAEGLAYLFAVREYVPDDEASRVLRQRTTLMFATLARNLGKYRLARQIADELLCEPPEPDVLVPALVLAASLWVGLGGTAVALGLVREAEQRLPGRPKKERAWVLHQKAKLLFRSGQTAEAQKILRTALATYRQLGDTYGEVRGLVLRATIQEKQGDMERALTTARKVIKLSDRHGHARGAVFGHLELGRLLAKSSQDEAALEHLTRGLSDAVRLKDHNAQFFAHYHLWKIHLAMNQRDRARFELNAASYFVQFVDERTSEVDEIARLSGKRETK